MEELRGVERAIREMAKKVADRARRVFEAPARTGGALVRGAFRPSQKPQPERTHLAARGRPAREVTGTGTCAGEVRDGERAGQAEGAHGGIGGRGEGNAQDIETLLERDINRTHSADGRSARSRAEAECEGIRKPDRVAGAN